MAVPTGTAVCAAAIFVRARAGAGPGRMPRSVRTAGVSGADGGTGGTARAQRPDGGRVRRRWRHRRHRTACSSMRLRSFRRRDQAIDHEHIEGEDRKRQA
jgi:hypothetical protein